MNHTIAPARVLSALLLISLVPVGLVTVNNAQVPAAPSPQSPVFRTGTTLVEVDVFVRDRKGEAVTDLTVRDFEVSEDGKPQQIDVAYMVKGGSRVYAGSEVPGDMARPTAATADGRTLVLVFDVEHMTAGATVRAKRGAAQFLAKEFHAGDIGGVIADAGLINGRLTSDRRELESAVESVTPRADVRSAQLDLREWPRLLSLFEASRIEAGDSDMLAKATHRACEDDPDQCRGADPTDLVRQKAGRLVTAAHAAAGRTLHTLESLINGLARMPGRKAVVYMSGGFYAEEDWSDLSRVVGAAGRASVRIYSIDARGLDRGSASSDILSEGPGVRATASDVPSFDIQQDGSNMLAVDSGGLMILNENDVGRALSTIARDTESYYVLGYHPTNAALDGTFRRLAVRVRRPGLVARARKGYTASPLPDNPAVATPARTPVDDAPSAPAAPPASEAMRATPALTPVAPPVPASPVLTGVLPPLSFTDPVRPPIDSSAIRLRPSSGAAAIPAELKRPPTEGATGAEAANEVQDGWTAYQRGDTKTAQRLLTEATTRPGAPLWAYYTLGWAQFAERDYEHAVGSWERVRAAVPAFEPVYFDVADAYLQLHRGAKALDVMNEARWRWATDIDVHNATGVIAVSLGTLDNAMTAFDRALAIAPNDTTTIFNVASVNELKYIRSLDGVPTVAERERAVAGYHRVLEAGGPLAEAASEGLRRLEPLDVTRVRCSLPTTVGTISRDAIHGAAVRLAWSPDAQSMYLWGVKDATLRVQGHMLVSVPEGRQTPLDSQPEWAGRYWSWKAAHSAPWLPALAIKQETRQVNEFNLGDPGDRDRAHRRPPVITTNALTLHDEVIGETTGGAVLPGLTFGWSPFAMGAIAYTDRDRHLVIMGLDGRKVRVPGAANVLLPAWSGDGRQIAYLETSGTSYRLMIVTLMSEK